MEMMRLTIPSPFKMSQVCVALTLSDQRITISEKSNSMPGEACKFHAYCLLHCDFSLLHRFPVIVISRNSLFYF